MKIRHIVLGMLLIILGYTIFFPEERVTVFNPTIQNQESASINRALARLRHVPEEDYYIFEGKVKADQINTIYHSDGYDAVSFIDGQNQYYAEIPEDADIIALAESNEAEILPLTDCIDGPPIRAFLKKIVEYPALFILNYGGTIFIGLFFIWLFTRKKAKKTKGNPLPAMSSNMGAKMNTPEAKVQSANVAKQNQQKKPPEQVKTFKDVAGLYEVKKDMQSLVDFLKNKDKYIKAGAKLPKGVIFYGPPGTGKTLLAKAIAGEANVPFYYTSGSDFIEVYVGVGPKRIRELFDKAKQNSPCIVFIDEIDAIGSRRSGNENSEDRKTLNALLTEMDGFESTDNILVIAATNRLEDLDPALTRPGRFTNKFCVPLPQSAKERLEIIKLYSKNKSFSEDVDLDNLAKQTLGFSPASIEALLNEAAIISVQEGKQFISKASIDKALFKILLQGHMKENQEGRDKEELEIVAWHEAGHALVGLLNGKEIPKVTILASTSGAGGVTFTTPKKMGLSSASDLKNEVKELYAGRIAETLLLKDDDKITTGASNDIERATAIIREIVTSYGMSKHFGLLNLEGLKVNDSVILEKEIELAKELEEETRKILSDKIDILKKIAEELLEKETLYDKDLQKILAESIDS